MFDENADFLSRWQLSISIVNVNNTCHLILLQGNFWKIINCFNFIEHKLKLIFKLLKASSLQRQISEVSNLFVTFKVFSKNNFKPEKVNFHPSTNHIPPISNDEKLNAFAAAQH
jgi:hypothetical protein